MPLKLPNLKSSFIWLLKSTDVRLLNFLVTMIWLSKWMLDCWCQSVIMKSISSSSSTMPKRIWILCYPSLGGWYASTWFASNGLQATACLLYTSELTLRFAFVLSFSAIGSSGSRSMFWASTVGGWLANTFKRGNSLLAWSFANQSSCG